ncbi:hypothetical protein D9758_018722 [Tetrapyrgos nigripes]|uniref:Uncharacterized protein n=1 Tax=Tetrapyrgos nigripes TaxID=182062 RepID=A0A8H5B971_9AGAR|nr:hypothetical protein D9758_018722 [Tetrapyrgos nigripes]
MQRPLTPPQSPKLEQQPTASSTPRRFPENQTSRQTMSNPLTNDSTAPSSETTRHTSMYEETHHFKSEDAIESSMAKDQINVVVKADPATLTTDQLQTVTRISNDEGESGTGATQSTVTGATQSTVTGVTQSTVIIDGFMIMLIVAAGTEMYKKAHNFEVKGGEKIR